MSKNEKALLKRIILSAVIFIILIPLHYRNEFKIFYFLQKDFIKYIELPLFIVPYLIIGYDILIKAFKNIIHGKIFDENFLMTVATIGAFVLGEYPEAVAVMLFYQTGELFQSYAVSKSRRSITELMNIRPDYANIMKDGELIKVDPEELSIGDIIIVKPGEKIPLDGIIKEGSSLVDTSALTGESIPRDVSAGEAVISGCVNLSGLLTIEVEKEFSQSTVSKILELVEEATDKKSKSENFITKFAKYYTPFVIAAAVLLAVLPPLISGQAFRIWIERALTFLVISCPCALVISVPLSFFGGIGGASKEGILIKGSNYLENLSKVETIVFDKTGTLTKGKFIVTEIYSPVISSDELLELTAHAEEMSAHPIAESIKKAYGKIINKNRIKNIEEIIGHGLKCNIDEAEVYAGNAKLMERFGIEYKKTENFGSIVHVAKNNQYLGYIRAEDEIKSDAKETIEKLKNYGIKNTVMLTGDNKETGEKVAGDLGLDYVYTELLPAGKLEKFEEILKNKSRSKMAAYVGDGINDSPVLARADIGIAMGGMGTDAAIEAADVVIMNDEPSKILNAINISKKTIKIVRQNICFALGVKAIVLVLGALGIANMWAAVFADVGVSVIAILNAMRALNTK
ncbi:cadmium-translocating P-type ATPase [Eubacteriales bacterium OttesenSCG-928-G02]|nr:cadmium-translocating P-type ATPase [Eubacteriales bacterium OttesenSCG-928-G02]